MKKRQKNFSGASALQITLSVALISISAILLASSFKAAPAASGLSTGIAPSTEGGKNPGIAGPASVPSLSRLDTPFTFSYTGSLNTARYVHTATLLHNGKVLAVGGANFGNALASAELYDPARGSWSSTGSLNTARAGYTATLLPNGKVLVAAGEGNSSNVLTSAELFNPATGTWSATGSLDTARSLHTATLLPNGKVLVAGGVDTGSNSFASA
jgi:WD40 repeat protein